MAGGAGRLEAGRDLGDEAGRRRLDDAEPDGAVEEAAVEPPPGHCTTSAAPAQRAPRPMRAACGGGHAATRSAQARASTASVAAELDTVSIQRLTVTHQRTQCLDSLSMGTRHSVRSASTAAHRPALASESSRRCATSLREGSFHEATVEQVASRAGVSRATLYQRFGSRLGLVDAICETFDANPALVAIREAVRDPDPRGGLERAIAHTVGFWASEEAVLEPLYGAAAIDPAARDLVARQRADRRGEYAGLLGRMEEAGRLRPGLAARRRAGDPARADELRDVPGAAPPRRPRGAAGHGDAAGVGPDAARSLEPTDQGTRASRIWRAATRSSSPSSDSRTGVTSVQCRPTGQRWNRHHPSRTDLSEAPGIQIVVKRWPARQRTTTVPAKRPVLRRRPMASMRRKAAPSHERPPAAPFLPRHAGSSVMRRDTVGADGRHRPRLRPRERPARARAARPSGRGDRPATRLILRAAGVQPGMRVLDLGTGPGHVALMLAEMVGPSAPSWASTGPPRRSRWRGAGPTITASGTSASSRVM